MVSGHPFSHVPSLHGEAQKPASLPTGRTRREERSPPAAQGMRQWAAAPGSAQGHPLAAPARSPTSQSATWCPGMASPCPQRVAWEPSSGAEAGIGTEDGGGWAPGRGGRRALPDSWGHRLARYSRPAWRSRARSRPQAPGRASAHDGRVWEDRPNGDPFPGADGQPSTATASIATGPRGTAAANQRAAWAANQDAEHKRTLSGGTLGYQEEEGAAGGAQVAVETASLPSGAPKLEGRSNCSLETKSRSYLQLALNFQNWESVGFVYSNFIPWIIIFKFWRNVPWELQK